jgi:hypothetical protein
MNTRLEFLQMGGELVFPSGYKLKGDPETGYIDTFDGMENPDGIWNLNEEGLGNAIKSEQQYRQETEEQG